MRVSVVMRCGLVAAAIAAAGAAAGFAVAASSDEARILAHGPWPLAFAPDPSNRASGEPLAIELGRRLFFDPRMSPSGYIACVSCHQPDRAFTDAKARAHGLADLDRNTISLANLRLQQRFGWAGASDSVWIASKRPILDSREFDGSAASATRLFRRDEEFERCYRAVFRESPFDDDERTLVNVAKALAAFVETLQTGRTPFDTYRDALARGDHRAASRYPFAAQRGLRLFVGRAGCDRCHSGPNFSDGSFHFTAEARSTVERTAFRTPSLRNVAVTAPYMHDGSIETLREVVRVHAPAGTGPDSLRRLTLSSREIDDLVAFLQTLTDTQGERRMLPATSSACFTGG
jgi:cytochrome c peroxidase